MYTVPIECKEFKELKDGTENGRNLRKGTCFDVRTYVYTLYIGVYTGWNSSKLLRILRHNDTLFRFLFCQTARELAAVSASLPIGGNMAQSASYDLLGPLLFLFRGLKRI